jgi:hypothetical protein
MVDLTMIEGHVFTEEEQRLLRRIAGVMIPAAPADGLPGADDDVIFARLLAKASARVQRLQQALHDLSAENGGTGGLLALADSEFVRWFETWANRWPDPSHSFFNRLAPLLAHAYYEDPRVQQAHNRRPGPPFPEGYVVIQGDWSLLDQVRNRPPLYRR